MILYSWQLKVTEEVLPSSTWPVIYVYGSFERGSGVHSTNLPRLGFDLMTLILGNRKLVSHHSV